MTSAPWSPSIDVAQGPVSIEVTSMIRIPFSGPDICDLYAKIIVTLQKGCLGREISFENLVVMDELPDLDSKQSEILRIFDCM
ncbi:hypothetical protein MGWOODY_XGa2279 [hydrothermal vent metagenome]|uniref:Uncharacterized protein n=1 Tax=hydrothermal vent metagenome TaxID=652676 RepID=A0A160TWN7_9ZZZZ